MEGDNTAGGDVPSLHDEFLQTLHDTGMYNYAQDIDLIQDGQLPEVRMHEDMRLWPAPEEVSGVPMPAGLSEEDLHEGEARIAAANDAAEKGISAAEQVKMRQRASHEAGYDEDGLQFTPSKPRKARKGVGRGGGDIGGRSSSKGLRHFSMKVCEKVEGKGRTTYNEVADELVNDLPGSNDPGSPGGMQYDEKNIRRRVYDALNVLMAMDIISREKKEIFWKGLPQGPQLSLDRLRAEKHRLFQKLDQQRRYVAELAQQQATYTALIRRNQNRSMEQLQGENGAGSPQLTALPLPFVLIQVDRNATVEIKISDDNRVAHFDFEGMPFKFTGDEQVLQEMGLHNPDGPLTARAVAAAGDAMLPRAHNAVVAPRTQFGQPPAAGPSSRAHPIQIPAPTPVPGTTDGGLNLLGSAAAAASQNVSEWQRAQVQQGISNAPHGYGHHKTPELMQQGPGPSSQQANGHPFPSPRDNFFTQPPPLGMSAGAAAMEMSPQIMNMVPTQAYANMATGWPPFAPSHQARALLGSRPGSQGLPPQQFPVQSQWMPPQ